MIGMSIYIYIYIHIIFHLITSFNISFYIYSSLKKKKNNTGSWGDEALINQGFLDANSMKYTGVFHDGILILEILPRDPGMVP